ncbi:MAG: MFS transporter [Rhodobacteraceae bacterium]|nr:MFS transporter [Paracoccaceae bacterium]
MTISQLKPDRFGLTFLSAFGFAQICSWGTLFYAFPQIALAMETDLGWDRSALYGALTLGLLLSAAAAVPVGIMSDKGHGRIVMSGGSVLAGLFFVLWSQSHTLTWYYFSFAGIGLLQAAVLYTAAFAVVARHCDPSKTRHYITVLTLWGGFASTVFIPLIEAMLSIMDWRQVLLVLAAVNVVLCAGIYWKLPTGDHTEKTDSGIEPKRTSAWALAQPVFWALLVYMALHAVIENAFRFHLYPMFIENGIGSENAVFLLALLGPAQVVGRIVINFWQTRSISSIGMFVAALIPIALLAMLIAPNAVPILMVATVTYGAAAGILTIVNGMAVPELLTRSSYGLINGMMQTPMLVLRAFAPSIAALSYSATGSYSGLLYGLVVSGVLMVLAFGAAVVLSKRTRRELHAEPF